MLIRIVELAAMVVAALLAWQALRPHRLLRVPLRWRWVALQRPQVREALRLRQSMARLVRDGRARDGGALMADFDHVLAALVETLAARDAVAALPEEARGKVPTASEGVEEAMGWLRAAHGHLVDLARAELDDAVGEVRRDLQDHTEALRLQVEARRELERDLQAGNQQR